MAAGGGRAPWSARAAAAIGSGVGGVLGGPVGAALLGGGISLAQNIWSARRADSAHQREVKDLIAAGVNPMLTASGGSGSPTAPMTDVGEGVSSALAVKRQKSEIELLQAQAHRELMSARLAATQANEISTFAPGRAAEVANRAEVASLDASQRRAQLEVLRDQLRAQIQATLSSARASNAVAALNELDFSRMENIQKFEESLGAASPTIRMIFEAIRVLSAARR